jgi:hypothetical protein
MRKVQSYKGFPLYPMCNNVLGSYWEALTTMGWLRADTLQGIKELIDQKMSENITEKTA